MKEDEDNLLVDRCLEGDNRAFEKLVRKYEKTVFNVIYQMVRDFSDAEDLTQTVFVKVYQNLEKYDEHYRFYSWLYRITINETLNHLQQKKAVFEIPENYESMDKTPDRILDETEMIQYIDGALAALDPTYRILIIMRHFLDLSYREMSEIVRVPEKKVKSRLYMARQIMARYMIEKGIVKDEA